MNDSPIHDDNTRRLSPEPTKAATCSHGYLAFRTVRIKHFSFVYTTNLDYGALLGQAVYIAGLVKQTITEA